MKATINVEFGSEELEKFALSLAGRLFAKLGGTINPTDIPTFFALMQQGMDLALGHFWVPTRVRRAPGPGLRPNGAPPPGGPFGGPVGSQDAPWPPPGMAVAQPIHGESSHVERCFAIEANRNTEAGVGCCQCATNNALTRTNCRRCGHKLCVILTPPSAEEPEGPA